MPANPKYLTASISQRFAKISAAVIGGYLLSATLHLVSALLLPSPKIVFITSVYTLYLLWGVLLLVPFLYKNGWRVWLVYLVLLGIMVLLIYFNPRPL